MTVLVTSVTSADRISSVPVNQAPCQPPKDVTWGVYRGLFRRGPEGLCTRRNVEAWFDRLTTNGAINQPFAHEPFGKLRTGLSRGNSHNRATSCAKPPEGALHKMSFRTRSLRVKNLGWCRLTSDCLSPDPSLRSEPALSLPKCWQVGGDFLCKATGRSGGDLWRWAESRGDRAPWLGRQPGCGCAR